MDERLLVIDDDEIFGARLSRALRRRGYDVQHATTVVGARTLAAQWRPHRAIIDLRLPDGSGLELLDALLEMNDALQAVILTGYGSIANAVDAVRLGAVGYVQKPANADEILAAFERGEAPPLQPPETCYAAVSLARAEWEHINRVLSDCGGNISEAARRLGLHRRTLQRKLQKYPPQN